MSKVEKAYKNWQSELSRDRGFDFDRCEGLRKIYEELRRDEEQRES